MRKENVMKNLFKLTRVQIGSAMEFIKIFNRGKRSKKGAGTLAILAGAAILFGFLSGMYSYAFGISYQEVGQLRLLPGLMMAAACMIIIVTTIYKVKGTLFGTKDYDMLMSLPVPAHTIVASRILLLYVINFFFVAVLMIPNMIVYGYLGQPEIGFYFRSIFGILLLPLVPMIVATVLGTMIALVASRFRHSNLINIILFLVFFCVIMGLSFQMQDQEQLAVVGDALTKQVEKIYPLAGMYLEGVMDGNLGALAAFAGISVAAFVLFCFIVGKFFKKLNTSIAAVTTKSNYKMKEQKTSSPFQALLKKELKRVFSSTFYLLNTCMSMAIMTIASLALLIVRPEQFVEMLGFPGMADMVTKLLPFLFAVLSCMTYSAACSISMEGKSFWILRSAPVEIKTIFKAKLATNLILVLPLLTVNTILLGIFFKFSIQEYLLTFLIPAMYTCLTAVGGLVLNLKFPVMDWTNEAIVIKQSASSMIACLGGMLLGIAPLVLFFLVQPPILWLQIGTIVVVGLAAFGLWRLLKTWGVKRFKTL